MVAAGQARAYEAELVRGVIVDRATPDPIHAFLQVLLSAALLSGRRLHGIWVGSELRVRTSCGNERVIDVTVYRTAPTVRLPDTPPIVTSEILSPEDRFYDVYEKCEEYKSWGVEHVWVIDAKRRRLDVYEGGELHAVEELAVGEFGVRISRQELFAELG